MNKSVSISVIMTVYNTSFEFLSLAIKSILDQTFKDFEFIIIDDGSNDETKRFLKSFGDTRIIVVSNPSNLGLTASLNIGLKLAKGSYIARMDSDDISLPQRFEKQYEFMEKNKQVIVCGSWIKAFGKADYIQERILPDREYLRASYLFGNTYGLTHPTAFFRTEELRKNNIQYNESLVTAQDYGMWAECIEHGEIVNISEILLHYRIHDKQISEVRKRNQQDTVAKVQRSLLKRSFPSLSESQIVNHHVYCASKTLSKESLEWFSKLKKLNSSVSFYDVKSFNSCVEELLVSKIIFMSCNVKTYGQVFKLFSVTPLHFQIVVFKQILNRLIKMLSRSFKMVTN